MPAYGANAILTHCAQQPNSHCDQAKSVAQQECAKQGPTLADCTTPVTAHLRNLVAICAGIAPRSASGDLLGTPSHLLTPIIDTESPLTSSTAMTGLTQAAPPAPSTPAHNTVFPQPALELHSIYPGGTREMHSPRDECLPHTPSPHTTVNATQSVACASYRSLHSDCTRHEALV